MLSMGGNFIGHQLILDFIIKVIFEEVYGHENFQMSGE